MDKDNLNNAAEAPQGPGRIELGDGAFAWTAGSGHRLLLLHGWGLRPYVFVPSLRQLADRGFEVAVPTLAHVGRTWDIGRAVHRARKTLDTLEWDEAIVVGYSLGGAVATNLAATHPERVRMLVLVNSVGLSLERNLLAWSRPFTRYARTGNLRALRAFSHNAIRLGGLLNLAAAGRYARTASLDAEFGLVAGHGTPAAVLWGADDALLPPQMGRAVADTLGAPFHVIPNADHDWPVVQPVMFARELDLLLRSMMAEEPKARRRR